MKWMISVKITNALLFQRTAFIFETIQNDQIGRISKLQALHEL